MKYFGKHFWYITVALIIVSVCSLYLIYSNKTEYSYTTVKADSTVALKGDVSSAIPTEVALPIPVTHVSTPKIVKAIYASAWTMGSPVQRDRLIALIDKTELNSIVIDVKDSTGYISFEVNDPTLKAFGSYQKRIRDIRSLTNMLHKKNIYIIGRISTLQDSLMTVKDPSWALTKKSDGTVWKDHKGFSFMDPSNKDVLDYTTLIAKEAYSDGFDEINFDYIRYPSDGNIKDINYHIGEGKTRASNMRAFFEGLNKAVKDGDNIPTSADLFGLTATEKTDMGIGQVIEDAIPNFDFIAPMVYPSHFATGFGNYKIPADHPYEVVNTTMKSAVARAIAIGFTADKIRPWIQDFSIKDNGFYVKYTPEMVRAQMKGANDAAVTSWMIWDPSNKYTQSALTLLPESSEEEVVDQNKQN